MRRFCLFAVAVLLTFMPSQFECRTARADSNEEIVARIDALIEQGWKDNEVTPSDPADDYEFARRAWLDTVGHIPPLNELTSFIDDKAADKRIKLVDQLLEDPAYVRNWTSFWGNLLIGRANNRGGGRAALDRWLRNAFQSNLPYNEFVRELITAEGNSNDNGAVVFLASHLNDGARPATAITARLFLGRQVQCTECHNHPFNDWQQSQFWSMNAFFSGSRRQGNANEGVTLSDAPSIPIVQFERRNGTIQSAFRAFFDGTIARNSEDRPRTKLAELMLDPSRPYLAQTQVNRMWGHYFGYAFTKPVDDMGPHNLPSHPELLDYLAAQFQEAGYDNRRLIRWLTRSRAYNLSSKINDSNADDAPGTGSQPLFSHMYLKAFSAEQLYDSLLIATAADQANRNAEQSEQQRQQWLQQFVTTFGTDENDESTSFNGTIPQALMLMNGGLMQNALGGGQGSFLRRVVEAPNGRPQSASQAPATPAAARKAAIKSAAARTARLPDKIETLFLTALGRMPSEAELKSFNANYQRGGYRDPVEGLQDVFWALLNSNEFIINH